MKTKMFLTVLFISFLPVALNAADKEEDKDHSARIELAYIFGGQVYNDNFLYNPGISVLGSYGKNIQERIYMGIGTGAMGFRDATFVPVFVDFTGNRTGKKNTGFLTMQLGYSMAWSRYLTSFNNSEFRGGIYIGAGLGRQFEVSDAFNLAVFFIYRHQFASIEYQVFDMNKYREEVNYDMLSFGIRFIL